MNISIIIPNFNGKNLLEKNLPLVILAGKEYLDGKVEIVIVDDGSKDYSAKFIKNNYPMVKLITQDKNTGFAHSCNVGVKSAAGEIIILLNSDVVPDRNFIRPLINRFADPQVFAVGCLEKSSQNGKEILSGKAIGYYNRGLIWHNRAKDQLTPGPTFWVAGGSGAFRKHIWEKLGGFDPIFAPFYWEDIDLSYRAQKAGYQTLFEPQSLVFHQHESTISTFFSKSEIDKISSRNQHLFFLKNITDPKMLILYLLWMPYHFLISLSLFSCLKSLPAVLKKRQEIRPLLKISDTKILAKYY